MRTAQVQALMRALRARGLTIVPEPLGLDEQGREVVEYVEGDLATSRAIAQPRTSSGWTPPQASQKAAADDRVVRAAPA
jgi:hypothetical protein